MNAIKNITVGHTERLRKPVGFTMLANLVNIVPFCLSIEAVNVIFRACDGSGTPLDTARLWTIFGILAVYMAAMALAERTAYRANFRGAYEMSAEGRISLAEHLRKLSLGFLSRRDPGDLSSMLITDFTMAETGISHHLPQLMGAMVMPVLAFLTLLWIDWRMATAMFVALPLAIGILLASTRIQQKLSSHQIAAKIEAGNRLEEYLQGIRVMKAYNMVGGRFVRLREAFAQLRRASIRQEALLGPFVLLSITVVRAGLTLMVLCGTYLLLDGTLSLLMFVMFLIVGSRVFDPLTSALTNFAEFRYFSIAGGRILSLMEEPEMTGNRKAPKNGDITLEGVSFAYRDKEVLHDVSLTLPQGSLTALVGPSGSGKSTLMKLCARFYDPQRGHVLFNGIRMDEIEPESLMRHISMVFQDVYLFQDTIRNNIRFGKADATDEQIVAAAKKACSHDFIMRLPKGYDTMVGEGGCTLSGGEKQRLSIARAILKDAQTILLDEATASLDPENEVEVQRAINTLIAGRTVIVIAHRLKTIRNADNIVVLDQGRIAEQGTHDQLVAHGGLYARLWAIQERTAGGSITSGRYAAGRNPRKIGIAPPQKITLLCTKPKNSENYDRNFLWQHDRDDRGCCRRHRKTTGRGIRRRTQRGGRIRRRSRQIRPAGRGLLDVGLRRVAGRLVFVPRRTEGQRPDRQKGSHIRLRRQRFLSRYVLRRRGTDLRRVAGYGMHVRRFLRARGLRFDRLAHRARRQVRRAGHRRKRPGQNRRTGGGMVRTD